MPTSFLLPAAPVTSLSEYRDRGGGEALALAQSLGPSATIDVVGASGLRGRGGAGFPAGRKWASIRAGGTGVGNRYVVANGAEGEPGSFKDRELMARNAYQVVEGLAVAAFAVGAVEAYLAVKNSFTVQIETLTRATREFSEAGLVGDVPITLVTGPDEYLLGEETGLLEVVEGDDPLPRLFPPYLYGLFTTRPQFGWSAGVNARADVPGEQDPATGSNPTLVSNVETLANVPLILTRGPAWYRSLGTSDSPGVALTTVVGDVVRPAVGEVELGTPLRQVLDDVAGGPRPGRNVQAVLSGVANAVLTADRIDTPATYEDMSGIDSGLGALGFIVYDDTADMVAVAHAVSRFLWVESCGQCPACKFGTGEVTAYLERILRGEGSSADVELIGARLRTVTDANRCYLGREEQIVVGSLLKAFPEQFVAHLEGTAAPWSPIAIPKIVDLIDGETVLDDRHALKQPDWTYSDPQDGAAGIGQ